jgi:hypothetical protein
MTGADVVHSNGFLSLTLTHRNADCVVGIFC